MATVWYIYAETEDFNSVENKMVVLERRFVARHSGPDSGRGICELYAHEAEEHETIIMRRDPYTRLVSNLDKQDRSIAAATLRAIPSAKRSEQSAVNGAKGGRPRKSDE